MGHCQTVLRVAEPIGTVVVVDYDDTECFGVSTNIGTLQNGLHDWELEVCLADSGHAFADLVECAVHFRAPGSLVGLVLMGVGHAIVRSYNKISFQSMSTIKRYTNAFVPLEVRGSDEVD